MTPGFELKSSHRTPLLRVIRLLLAVAASALILVQLVPGVYVLKEFLFIVLPSPFFGELLQSSILLDPAFWRLLVSCLLSLVLAGVLMMVLVAPHSAWKLYVTALLLTFVAAALSMLASQSQAIQHTSVFFKGGAFVLGRGILTLVLLIAYSGLTRVLQNDGAEE